MTPAAELFPGGVNSPVRAYRAVGGEPPVLVRGEGAYVWDTKGRRFIDYVGAFGPLALGHAPVPSSRQSRQRPGRAAPSA